MKSLIIALFVIFFQFRFYSVTAQSSATVSRKEIGTLIGIWQGALTYLDYTSNKPFTMPADIEIKQIEGTNKFLFFNSYPNEPNANSVDTIILSEDGKTFNDESVKSKRIMAGGGLEIITELSGEDGNENKPALIRHTYLIFENIFTIIKDIQFLGQKEWIKRHEYNYKKKL